jgi:hypothetical protein
LRAQLPGRLPRPTRRTLVRSDNSAVPSHRWGQWLICSALLASALIRLPLAQAGSVSPTPTVATPPSTVHGSATHYQPNRFAGRAGTYYKLIWGVDSLVVRWAESGEIIRFSYRVVDAEKAKALSNDRSAPTLNCARAGVSLVVPSMENVGQLRQSGDVENSKSYWMAFSNKGGFVKRGDHVSVVIGQFKADGLVVD